MTAVLALIGTIIAAFFGSLIAEDYRRFRDGQGIAAAIGGEISGYVEGGELIQQNLAQLKVLANSGHQLPFTRFDPPKDVLYEALADRLGLLGPDLARDAAYVYQRIYGFRVGYMILTRDHEKLSQEAIVHTLTACENALLAVKQRAQPLLVALAKRASEDYKLPRLPKLRLRPIVEMD
jgi:hypothetical protein